MNQSLLITILSALALALTACSALSPDPPATPTATFVAAPTIEPSPTAPTAAPTITAAPPPAPCPAGAVWFFTFTIEAPAAVCPGPVGTAMAVGQDFEGGRVYWYAAQPVDSDQRGTIFVIYNDGDWETFVNLWEPAEPDYDPAITPPPERLQPVQMIGKLWRENAEVQQRLGWAYEPQQLFNGRMQTYDLAAGEPPDPNAPTFYVDHGKWDIVLGLTSVDMGPNTWIVAGETTALPSEWLTYGHDQYKFTISHPTTLEVVVDEQGYGRIGQQIFLAINEFDPLACRGDCPVIETVAPVTIAAQEATKVTGYFGSIGGYVPQQYLMVVFTRENLYYQFTLYAVGQVAPDDDFAIQPLQMADVVLFSQVVATFNFMVEP